MLFTQWLVALPCVHRVKFNLHGKVLLGVLHFRVPEAYAGKLEQLLWEGLKVIPSHSSPGTFIKPSPHLPLVKFWMHPLLLKEHSS
jgi:hypothetical protein